MVLPLQFRRVGWAFPPRRAFVKQGAFGEPFVAHAAHMAEPAQPPFTDLLRDKGLIAASLPDSLVPDTIEQRNTKNRPQTSHLEDFEFLVSPVCIESTQLFGTALLVFARCSWPRCERVWLYKQDRFLCVLI